MSAVKELTVWLQASRLVLQSVVRNINWHVLVSRCEHRNQYVNMQIIHNPHQWIVTPVTEMAFSHSLLQRDQFEEHLA